MPWPEWGETDFLLTQAYDITLSMRCSCGCGQWSDEARDPDTDGLWVVRERECFARKASVDWVRDNKPDPHVLISVTLGDPDDPLDEYDPIEAQRMHAELQQRLGQGGDDG